MLFLPLNLDVGTQTVCFINGMMMDTNIKIFDHIKSNSYTIMLSSEFYKNNNLHREDIPRRCKNGL